MYYLFRFGADLPDCSSENSGFVVIESTTPQPGLEQSDSSVPPLFDLQGGGRRCLSHFFRGKKLSVQIKHDTTSL